MISSPWSVLLLLRCCWSVLKNELIRTLLPGVEEELDKRQFLLFLSAVELVKVDEDVIVELFGVARDFLKDQFLVLSAIEEL